MILLVEHQASCASLSWTRQANPGFASRPPVWTNSHRYSAGLRLVPPKGVIALRSRMARQPSNPGPRGRSGTIQLRIASKTEILAPRESPGNRDPWCRANEMAPTMIRTARAHPVCWADGSVRLPSQEKFWQKVEPRFDRRVRPCITGGTHPIL
jgi:hypothetical protein